MLGLRISIAATLAVAVYAQSQNSSLRFSLNPQSSGLTALGVTLRPERPGRPERCPPCFNCQLDAFNCGHFGECSKFDGQCKCPPGWAGIDCLTPQCDSLADGEHRRQREDGQNCECKDGWGGVNCNVCENDNACSNFPLFEDPSVAEAANMTCYKGGVTVFENHQACDVTNRKILDQLDGRKPEVTFSCNKFDASCQFQFWTDQVESFYCGLNSCKSELETRHDSNITRYACDNMQCRCVPGRFICGEDGSVDIHEYFEDYIKGPATFECKTGSGCTFSEPAMNVLITTFFGDPYITLNCHGGECLHYSQVPGYVRPPKPDNTKFVAFSVAGAGLILLAASAGLWYAGRTGSGDFGKIRLPESETAKLMTDHVPASLHFSDISYTLPNGRTILSDISGSVAPGQLLAIMGPSGAGKSTFLEILARKSKRGTVNGTTIVNGREVSDSEFRKVVGFVDQEDTLMSTLTVYETVLYSALLRLPREMSLEAKKFRTLETLNELGILGIKDARIGSKGRRSISGGEKRRVSIACELVTSPSILFLDEPTSGLDAYNALSVVDSLVSLAKDYNRTVIFTIHQPRSNIVALFDKLVLLAQGKMIYSGDSAKCYDYLEAIKKPCPPGFNIADYLIDMTMHATIDAQPREGVHSASIDALSSESVSDAARDEERAFITPQPTHPISLITSESESPQGPPPESTETQDRPESESSSTGQYIRHKTSQIIGALTPTSFHHHPSGYELQLPVRLQELVDAFKNSDSYGQLAIENANAAVSANGTNGELPDIAVESDLTRGRRRAGWGTQFRILSGRAFKNLYRDPALLATHYIGSIIVAIICGALFHNMENDIAGFQNRLGMFFFTLALFGFSSLSSLTLFANERILFMRERANGYYSSFTYFASKILFDILPLRVVPPLVFGGIVYPLIGFVPETATFWKFMLTLVLFNLTTASVVLMLSIAFANVSVGSLVGTLVMLFNLLFTGLLINRDTLPGSFRWLITVSFFHAAFEALAVNELRYLQLREKKFGVELDVPAATILSTFGLNSQAFWWPDVSLLAIFFGSFTIISFLILHFYVKEKR
ncbi:ABC transporter domain-containing protein [Abortiporus biennis]